jgi:glycolate oxidase
MSRIEIDPHDACARVEAGAITGSVQEAAARHGLMYPPDPASLYMSTIGGNIACNAGGISCLKYGVTADYILGLTVVRADGSILKLGGATRKRASGYRLTHLFIGSEGTLGIVTEATLKLIPLPPHRATAFITFPSVESAADAVANLMAAGHLPCALELMDEGALRLVRHLLPAVLQPGVGAALLVEQDGPLAEVAEEELFGIIQVLGGLENRIAQSRAERDRLWEARRSFGKVVMEGRRNYFSEDIAVPLSRIPEMVRRLRQLSDSTGVEIALVGHAGDGNLHPNILFGDDQRNRAGQVAAQILRDAVELGGTISAEHGLGALKRDFASTEHPGAALELMKGIKDLLDPNGILNPGKIFPTGPADDEFLSRQPGWGQGHHELGL